MTQSMRCTVLCKSDTEEEKEDNYKKYLIHISSFELLIRIWQYSQKYIISREILLSGWALGMIVYIKYCRLQYVAQLSSKCVPTFQRNLLFLIKVNTASALMIEKAFL
jgi:hypothetical protein